MTDHGHGPYYGEADPHGLRASGTDAIIAMASEVRASLVRNAAEIIDDLLLNADTTATNNINAYGATISASDSGKGHWLIGFDGILKAKDYADRIVIKVCLNPSAPESVHPGGKPHTGLPVT